MQESHVEARLVAVELDVGDFKAGLGCAVGEVGVGVGGGAEGGTVCIAECRGVDVPVDSVNVAASPENPIGVRLFVEVKHAVPRIIKVVKVDVVIPSADNHAAVRDVLHEIVAVAILEGEPLVWVYGRTDEVAVVVIGGGVAVQHIVSVFGDFDGFVNDAQELVFDNGGDLLQVVLRHLVPKMNGLYVFVRVIVIEVRNA